jgi:hypothetical protein
MMAFDYLVKVVAHPLGLILGKRTAPPLSVEKSINPGIVKRVKFEGVFRPIQIRTEIVSGMSGQTGHDAGT